MKLIFLCFFIVTMSFSSDFIMFKDQSIKIISEEKTDDITLLYFDIGNIKESQKFLSCLFSSHENILDQIFCIKKDDLQTYTSKVDGFKENDKVFVHSLLFDLQKFNTKVVK